MELNIGFGDGKETTRPVLVDKEFNIPDQFPHLRSIEKNLEQHNSKLAFSFSRHNNKIKNIRFDWCRLNWTHGQLKNYWLYKGQSMALYKGQSMATGVAPFGNCNKFLFNKQKSIVKRPPPNTLLNYYTVLSEHAHCPENYVRQVL